jgi:hypothetical protein
MPVTGFLAESLEKYELFLNETTDRALSRMRGDTQSDYEKMLDESARRGGNELDEREPER